MIRQLSFTGQQEQTLPLAGARVTYHPEFFPPATADYYFKLLKTALDWQQVPIVLFGRKLLQPRLIAWYGDAGVAYGYSGNQFQADGWIDPLHEIKNILQQRLGIAFNAVLCNLYRDGRDSMGWHSDDEIDLGAKPVIAAISLGATRPFRLRAKNNSCQSFKLELDHGSLLLMAGDTQQNWQHSLPKIAGYCEPRINLTFRRLPAPARQ